MTDDKTVDNQENIKQILLDRDTALLNYEKLQKAHNTLKEDLKELKANSANVSELQKQIEAQQAEKASLLQASNTLKAQFETFKQGVQQKEKRTAVSNVLNQHVKSSAIPTALKLIDLNGIELDDKGEAKTETITAAVEALKLSDPFLFMDVESNKGTTPQVKHAIDRVTQSSYEAEIAAAVKKKDPDLLEEIIAKYRK